FGIRPVILVRRIEDIVVSLERDLKQKAQRPTVGTGQEGYSFVWQDHCTRDLSDERRLDFVIDLAVPWFVNFYVSWHRLCEQRAIDAVAHRRGRLSDVARDRRQMIAGNHERLDVLADR